MLQTSTEECFLWRRLACRRVVDDAVGADVYVRALKTPTLGGSLSEVWLENRLATTVTGVKRDAVRHRSIGDTEVHTHRTGPSHLPFGRVKLRRDSGLARRTATHFRRVAVCARGVRDERSRSPANDGLAPRLTGTPGSATFAAPTIGGSDDRNT